MTSVAIMETLATSSDKFGAAALGRPLRGQVSSHPAAVPLQFVALLAWTALVLAARYRPQRWARRVLLAGSLMMFGFAFNLQYASQQVLALFYGNFSRELLSAGFFLVVVVPLVVVFFGNVYCGYLCPFGALQELIGDLRPSGTITDPGKNVWRYGRMVKYLLLFLFFLLFAATLDFSVLHADPLITVFGAVRDSQVTVLALGLLSLSFFFRRFWCRNLCPAGAFLSLVGGLRLFRRFLPRTRPGACDLGVRNRRELDCLQCDRCRHEKD